MAFLTDPQLAATAVTDPTPARGQPQQLAANTLFAGRYRIERRLGAGGMGTVFAAHDTLTDQAVAIKLVAGHRTQIERIHLREEVRATMLLTHRNIARTYTLDEVDGEIFIVMELLEGETLATRIARGPIPRGETLAILHQLIDALAEAHRHGIVHCDVKPANIMCCTDGRVVLMDFGLACREDPSASLTGTIRGTPAYMAPEVVSGRHADARADIYAVGLILYEMLTGEPPFKARSVDELLDSQLYDVIDTRAFDEVLTAAIVGATAKDPAQRFATLDELRAAFLPRPKRRAFRISLAAVAVLVGLALGFACVRWLSPRADAVAAPVQVASARELELQGMLKTEILASFQALERRACACPNDVACGRHVLDDLIALGKRIQRFEPDIDQTQHDASMRLAVCLFQTGIDQVEFFDVVRRIRGLPPDTTPREGAW